MIEWIEYGYWGLFFASFLAATVLPFSSEAMLVALLVGGGNPYTLLIVSTAGNWLGGMSSYYIGYLGNWNWIEKKLKIKESTITKWNFWLNKYGSYLAFLCWVPIIGDPLAVALGLWKSNIYAVSIFMFIGKLLRYAVVLWLASGVL